MKKLLILAMIVTGSFIASSASAQVQVQVNFERDYPGYTYYEYPRWHGHYRDREYFEHYHARFEREHRDYFRDRNFDHERFEREHHWRDRH